MIKVISFTICPFVQRVTALLEAKSLPYEIEFIVLSNPTEAFLAVSPNAQVPLLVTESGAVLFESDAIVEYLDDIAPPIEPAITAEQRALDRAWSYQASKHYLVQCGAMTSVNESDLDNGAARLGQAFARAESQMQSGPYFKGEKLSNVDVAWLPLLHRAAIIERRTGYDFVAQFPTVKAWQTALMGTGLAEKSVAEDFEDAFAAFYLSDKTFLGSGNNRESPSLRTGGSGCCG